MKIMLPADTNNINDELCPSFGRAPLFCIYDDISEEITFIENEAAKSAGGAGIKAAQSVVDSGAKVLITPRLGKNAADVMEAAGVKLYKSTVDSMEKNIQLFSAKKLNDLEDIHPGFHNHGGE